MSKASAKAGQANTIALFDLVLLQFGAADAEIKSHLVRTHSLYVLPLKPSVGQYTAIHAMLTARDFFLTYWFSTFLVHSPAFFPKPPDFFPMLVVANTGSCVGPQNRIGHPAGCRFPCWMPAEHKKAKKNMTYVSYGMMTCEMNNLEIEWSLCSALM